MAILVWPPFHGNQDWYSERDVSILSQINTLQKRLHGEISVAKHFKYLVLSKVGPNIDSLTNGRYPKSQIIYHYLLLK